MLTVLQLHHPKWIERWCPKDIHAGFWEISSAVNGTLANILVAQKDLKVKEIQKLVGLLEEILIRRTEFLRKQKEIRPEFSTAAAAEARSNASTKLEVALLVHLCSAEPDLVSSCVKVPSVCLSASMTLRFVWLVVFPSITISHFSSLCSASVTCATRSRSLHPIRQPIQSLQTTVSIASSALV